VLARATLALRAPSAAPSPISDLRSHGLAS
jgi:hypothetical protein